MNELFAELMNDSYERCLMRPGFLDRFYEIFISSSPAVAVKFKNTEFEKQKRMLKTSLYMLMSRAGFETLEISAHLERIAELHSKKHLDIKPELYDLWLDSLVQAVSEFDPAFNAEIATAWRQILSSSIQLMKSRYS